jgi:hypothetical protein
MSSLVNEEILEKTEELKSIVMASVTGGAKDDDRYRALRSELLAIHWVKTSLPRFIRTCNDLSQVWHEITMKEGEPAAGPGKYKMRRTLITEQFFPLINHLQVSAEAAANTILRPKKEVGQHERGPAVAKGGVSQVPPSENAKSLGARRIEKTVFISYRRTAVPWAQSMFQNLTQNGYDAFFDFRGIASGGFEEVILENIKARAHFVVLLTPSALERCSDPADLFRREIETALINKRNIVPIMLEGFEFGAADADSHYRLCCTPFLHLRR